MRVMMDQHYRYDNRAMWRQTAEEDHQASFGSPISSPMQPYCTPESFKRRARSPEGSNYDDERHQKHPRFSLEASHHHYDSNYSDGGVPQTHLSKSKQTLKKPKVPMQPRQKKALSPPLSKPFFKQTKQSKRCVALKGSPGTAISAAC